MSVRPLVSWDDPNGGSLRDYVQELAADVAEGTGADASSLGDDLWNLLQAAELVPSQPPAGWQVSVTTPTIEAQAGQAVPVEVSILAPTAGAAALALEAADQSGAGTAASEIVVVRWNSTLGEGVIEFAAEPFLLQASRSSGSNGTASPGGKPRRVGARVLGHVELIMLRIDRFLDSYAAGSGRVFPATSATLDVMTERIATTGVPPRGWPICWPALRDLDRLRD